VRAAVLGQASAAPVGRRSEENTVSTMDLAKRYVAMVREDKYDAVLHELFTDDAVSVEAGAPPGQDPVSKGREALLGKGKWWRDNHDVHGKEISDPFPNGDRFAVRFSYDVTFKPEQKRFKMDEIGLFTVKDGKIVREEFFYSMG
jgi:ketosteroid isomerase-like protein